MKKLFGVLAIVVGLSLPLLSVAQNQDDQRHEERDRGRHDGWAGRLSAEDQSRFDSYYSRWLDYRQTNNRDQAASMEERMRDVMVRNSIPPNTDFSRIASPSAGQHRRRDIPRFSGDDAQRFSSYYSRWQQYRQTNNRGQMASMEGRMRDVMNRHRVPGDVSYDEMMNVLNGRDRH